MCTVPEIDCAKVDGWERGRMSVGWRVERQGGGLVRCEYDRMTRFVRVVGNDGWDESLKTDSARI